MDRNNLEKARKAALIISVTMSAAITLLFFALAFGVVLAIFKYLL